MTLMEADAHAVLEAAVLLTADPPPSHVGVLELLRNLVPCDSASFNDMALTSRDFRYVIVPEHYAAKAARFKPMYDKYLDQHPIVAAAASDPSLGALRFSDVPAGSTFESTELFQNFFAPFDIRFQLAIQVPSPPDVVVGYALNRSAAAGEFSDRDVEVLNTLSGHLAMHHRMVLERDRTSFLTDELDRHAWAVASVRSDGVVESSTSAVLQVRQPVPGALQHIVSEHGVAPQRQSRHEVTLGKDRWQCVVNPMPLGPTVLLLRRVSLHQSDVAALELAGLTPRQAVVLWELCQTGGSNAELALRLGTSEGTVKKHLENIFKALEVTSRVAAMLKANQLIE